jgi:hypothetical protein
MGALGLAPDRYTFNALLRAAERGKRPSQVRSTEQIHDVGVGTRTQENHDGLSANTYD